MKAFILFLLLQCGNKLFAQPHLQGSLTLNRKEGLIEADFTLSNLPRLSEYRLLLNHGMNIQYFTADSGKQILYDGFYGGKMHGEASFRTGLLSSFHEQKHRCENFPNNEGQKSSAVFLFANVPGNVGVDLFLVVLI